MSLYSVNRLLAFLLCASLLLVLYGFPGSAEGAETLPQKNQTIVFTTIFPSNLSSFSKMSVIYTEAFSRMGTWDLADAPGKKTPSVTVDTHFGARYTYLDLKLDFKGVYQDLVNNVNQDKSWVEPLVGVRTIWDISERWTATLAGDVGGVAFGSDFAWDALGLIGYRFNLFGEKNASAFAGYRALSQDYTDGSGNDKFEWDVTLYGPVLGLLIAF